MGSDLTVANAARVSYAKESAELSERDIRLIKFLAKEGHTSPFRHAIAQFEIYAPLMVARQWWKYIVGSAHQEGTGDSLDAWNESSRRYVTEEPTFYIPQADEWRSAPENSKQGSGDPIETERGKYFNYNLRKYIQQGEHLYDLALESGICAEQARLFLPAYGMYVRWYWTASLQSVAHFLAQRLEHDAQVEIQAYAKAILTLIEPRFPVAIGELIPKKEDE
ncbi:FAD-dependent thymidylate synthase [Paenibacillus chibensis]|uniref:FAD-dependent thymidylate synthase n=1 Tax=Paenibacillus chibensis TaxID=59846 RepID=UPI003530E281